jgi:RNA polymerase sigma factor (sigma-70 family)
MAEDISAEALAKNYGRMVSSICRRMIQDPDLAQDAAQQVWMEIIRGLPGFKRQSGVSTWIYTIARRIILDVAVGERRYSTRFLRGYFRGDERDLPDDTDLDKNAWVREMCDKCLTGMLHCLDNEDRLIYMFRDMVELPYEEIARIVATDQQAVRQTVSRTRRKLRNFLKDECILFNPEGACHCRMKKLVCEVELPAEYTKLRSLASTANVFLESEKVLPGKNYWLKYL